MKRFVPIIVFVLLISCLSSTQINAYEEVELDQHHDTPLQSAGVAGRKREPAVFLGASEYGDFVNLTQGASLEGENNQSVMDLWTGDPHGKLLEFFGNDTDWILEVWLNNSLSTRDLKLRALRYNGDALIPTPDFDLLSGVHNASIWAAEILTPTIWHVVIAGTRDVGGGTYAGFIYLLAWDGTDWTIDDADLEYLHDGNETVITDLKIDHADADGNPEIVLCGWVKNETRWNGLVLVYNITAVAGPLNLEHWMQWSHETNDIKHQALDIGALNGGEDVVVAGIEDQTAQLTGRLDQLEGSAYPWTSVARTGYLGSPTPPPSTLHDVTISDVDSDGTQEAVLAGDLAGNPLVVVTAWDAGEGYDYEVIAGADYGVYYEVEVANWSYWDSQEIMLFGKSQLAATGNDRALLVTKSFSAGSFTDIQWNDFNEFDRVVNYCELRTGDTDYSDAPELLLGWTREDKATQQRNDTVFDVSLVPYPESEPEAEQPPGKDRSSYQDSTTATSSSGGGTSDTTEEESETRLEYFARWWNENGWYVLMSSVVGVMIWFLAFRLGLLSLFAGIKDPRLWLITAGLIFLTIFQYPGIPVWHFWDVPRHWVWYRVTWFYDWVSSGIGSLLP